MYKNNQGEIEVLSVSKGTDGKEGPMPLFHLMHLLQEAWFSRSGGGLAPLVGNGNREKNVSLLWLGNAASFIHGYVGYLAFFGLLQLRAVQYFQNTVSKISL